MKSFWIVIILLCQGTIDCSKNLQIVGKKETAETSLFVVSIQKIGKHVCGGSIVANKWVLTTSICINRYLWNFKIRYGVLDCYTKDNINDTEREIVEQRKSDPNVLSLLKVNIEFDVRLYSYLAILPERRYLLPINNNGVLFGWAMRKKNTKNVLKTGKFVINERQPIINDHIETIYEFNAGGNGTGISKGDIGSPLIFEHLLIGVASNISKFNGKTPDIFYRVSDFVVWIRGIIAANI